MLPLIRLDAVKLHDGQELRLMQRGLEFSIMLGSNELMNSRLSGSEEALAYLACQQLAGRPNINMLIGGLGMGFTLRAALKDLGPDATVTVVELIPHVIAWANGPMTGVFNGCLDDPRTHLHQGDVGDVIRAATNRYDAILLDVDNGPEGLTRKGNDALYSATGLAAAHRALTKGGIFSVWSSAPDPAFTRRLKQAGFTVTEVPTRAGKGRGAKHMIWMAVRMSEPHRKNRD